MSNSIRAIALLCLVFASANLGFAAGHKERPGETQGAAIKQHHGVGKVNRIDLSNGTVNLTHGPIKSLGWMGMTMDFKVRDQSILGGLKVGENVTFELVREGPGKFYIVKFDKSN